MSISQRIKQVRKYYKYNQIDFAKMLNIKQASLSQIENEVIAPSLDVLKEIIGKFNISHQWILDGLGDMLKEAPDNSSNTLKGNIQIANGNNVKMEANNLTNAGKAYKEKYEITKRENEMLREQLNMAKEMIELLKKNNI